MKFKIFAAVTLSVGLLAACGTTTEEANDANVNNEEAEVVTTASLVNEADAFVNAVSENGTWIIATLSDITIDEEVVVAGEFYDKNDTSKDIYRKIAPYTQDADHNVLERFTITVPKMTIQSENTKIQAGSVAGDVYVEAPGFTLTADATIEGNLYFANADVEAAATVEGTVTGTTGVQETDVVTAASLVTEAAGFVNAASENGTWIIVPLNDITIDQEVLVAGEFYDKNDTSKDIYRKIAPYTQDADHNVLERFTITVPKMTIQSENTKIQAGTVAGDVYVEAPGFTLTEDATIEGNLYFASAEVEATALVEGTVTGTVGIQ